MKKLIVPAMLVVASNAFAQHAGHTQQSGYASYQAREIKALSPEQVSDLREGRGMGASLPAELNGAPGPMHALELAERLRLTADQRSALERVTVEMKLQAKDLGDQIIAAEALLDAGFKTGSIDDKGILEASTRIAGLQGQLRAVHLTAHLKTKRLLSAEQIVAYNEARGYAQTNQGPHKH